MESDILDVLDQVGYEGPLSDEESLLTSCGRGFSSPEYVSLLTHLLTRLTHVTDTPAGESLFSDDPDRWRLDLSRLLTDFCCPYKDVTSGLANVDVKDTRDHLKILLFLASELQAAEMLSSKAAPDTDVQLDTSLQDLRAICKTLNLPDPIRQESRDVLTAVEKQVCVLLKHLPETHIRHPAFKGSLDADEWSKLEEINSVLSAQYECRRRLLIKRLDVTVQSFSWSDRAKVRTDRMAGAYQSKRYSLSFKSSVSLAHVLAARDDICNVVKTSSGSCREKTTCTVNKILMGAVPDRGGRPSEIQAPLPEMPVWQKRTDGGGRGAAGRYGGGGYGRGGGAYDRWGGGSRGGWRQGNWRTGR
ncbi:protein FAM98B [Triplophysa dalaica]|uniref:protein FAM98B n=1 Tax=Triplophysa dalaica TaxID=1582913 RepID=UPI0024DFB641|nr:protein FAM98B [Triplophysa dalaica]